MATVDIIVRMIDQTGGASNKTIANLKDMAGKFAAVGAGAAVVAAAIKKTYDIAKEGAALQLTTDRFDRLSDSIGTTADALLGDLREATRGLYSDMELMTSATDFMSLGLAKSHDEAVRLAAVSSGLNMNMNQLVLTLTNMTTMRFDALGVQVDGFKEKVKELEESGMSAEAAFKEAFLQQAEGQLEKVGHAADSTAGEFMKLESTLKNTTDANKKYIAEGLAPTIAWLNEVLDASASYYDVLDRAAEAYGMTRRELRMMRGEQDDLTNSFVRAEQMGAGWAKILQDDITPGLDEATVSIEDAEKALKEMTKANREWLSLVGDISDEQGSYNDKMEEYKKELGEVAWSYGNNTQRVIDLQNKIEELHEKGANPKKIEKYKDELAKIPWVYDETTAAAQEVMEKMSEYTKEYELNSKRRILAGIEERLAADELTAEEVQRLEELGVAWGIYTEEAIRQARRERLEMGLLAESIMNIPTEWVSDIRINTIGSVPKFAASELDFRINAGSGRATGTNGWETVPAGFPNDTYPINLTSGESFKVIPAGQSGSGNSDVVEAIMSTRLDARTLAMEIVSALSLQG